MEVHTTSPTSPKTDLVCSRRKTKASRANPIDREEDLRIHINLPKLVDQKEATPTLKRKTVPLETGGTERPNSQKSSHPKVSAKRKRKNKRNSKKVTAPFTLEGSYVTVLHQNVNGIRARIRDGSLIEALEKHNPDVVALTEVKTNRKVFCRLAETNSYLTKKGYHYQAFHSSTKSPTTNAGYAGVMVLSKIPFDYVESGIDGDFSKEGRLIVLHFAHFCMAVAYSPNSGTLDDLSSLQKRKRFDKLLHNRLSQLKKPYILVGDLNVVSDHNDAEGSLSHSRYLRHPGCTMEEREPFHTLIEEQDLIDWQKHCAVPGFTFQISGFGNYRMRLDYILPQKNLVDWHAIRDFTHTRIMQSDHSGQLFKLDRGLFRRNTSPSKSKFIPEQGTFATSKQNFYCIPTFLSKELPFAQFATLVFTDDKIAQSLMESMMGKALVQEKQNKVLWKVVQYSSYDEAVSALTLKFPDELPRNPALPETVSTFLQDRLQERLLQITGPPETPGPQPFGSHKFDCCDFHDILMNAHLRSYVDLAMDLASNSNQYPLPVVLQRTFAAHTVPGFVKCLPLPGEREKTSQPPGAQC